MIEDFDELEEKEDKNLLRLMEKFFCDIAMSSDNGASAGEHSRRVLDTLMGYLDGEINYAPKSDGYVSKDFEMGYEIYRRLSLKGRTF